MDDISGDSNESSSFALETIDTAQSDRISTSSVIDLRSHRRVNTQFQAQMISEYGKVAGQITNLSCSGLRFEADRELSDLLMHDEQSAGYPPEVIEICFDVPAHSAAEIPIVVQARAVYVIDNGDGNYVCGVEFRVFAEGKQALIDYLHSRGVAI